jgi:fructose-1,6-bisphosphatase/inositol monophosphatase family enzyme
MLYSIGEETYAVDGKMDLTDDFTWIVDPIDGEARE